MQQKLSSHHYQCRMIELKTGRHSNYEILMQLGQQRSDQSMW